MNRPPPGAKLTMVKRGACRDSDPWSLELVVPGHRDPIELGELPSFMTTSPTEPFAVEMDWHWLHEAYPELWAATAAGGT